jgi:hypothetical protein
MTAKYGIQVDKPNNTALTTAQLAAIVASGAEYCRYLAIEWNVIEPNPPDIYGNHGYNLNGLAMTDIGKLITAGIKPIVIVKGCPTWIGQAHPCGPLLPGPNNINFYYFIEMLQHVMGSFPAGQIWEIWNEEEAPYVDDPTGNYYGCWGNPNDLTDYGGYDYGVFLSFIYHYLHVSEPNAKILYGGQNGYINLDSNGSKFFRAALYAAYTKIGWGVSFFDVMSIHSYSRYLPSQSLTATSQQVYDAVRSDLVEYSFSTKPVWFTEIGQECADDQAECCHFPTKLDIEKRRYVNNMWYWTNDKPLIEVMSYYALGVAGSSWMHTGLDATALARYTALAHHTEQLVTPY